MVCAVCDGRAGWLSEAGDLYVMTMPVEIDNPPKFEDTRAGFSELTFQDKHYIASDVRKISLKRAAAQGELPFVLKEDTENRVSDWRCENLFITLDYSNKTPEAFFGRMVNLDDLKLENTRHEDEIKRKRRPSERQYYFRKLSLNCGVIHSLGKRADFPSELSKLRQRIGSR